MPRPAFKHKHPDFTKDLLEKVRNFPSIAVGFPANKTGGIEYEEGERVIDVAIKNNYGTEIIPERPFMNVGSFKMVKDTKELRPKIAKAILGGKISMEDGLDRIGAKCAGTIKEVIKSYPEKYAETYTQKHNAPMTIARKKGVDYPLTDTGLLAKSVTFERRAKK